MIRPDVVDELARLNFEASADDRPDDMGIRMIRFMREKQPTHEEIAAASTLAQADVIVWGEGLVIAEEDDDG